MSTCPSPAVSSQEWSTSLSEWSSWVSGSWATSCPGLPGTLFLLIAAWLFSMSHPRLYRWMMTNRWFGQTLSDYRSGLGIPRRIKFISVSAIAVSVTASIGFAIDKPWGRLALAALGAYGIYFILTRPTREAMIEAVAHTR